MAWTLNGIVVKKSDWMKNLAVVFGERTGNPFIRPRDLRVVGHWLFHKDRDEFPDSEAIVCYRLPLPMCAEPWSDIPLADSPFKPHNKEAVRKAIKKLDLSYKALN